MVTIALMTRIGEALAILRERAGMSRKTLGELSGVSPGTIQLIESGETDQPEPTTLRRLSVGLATNRATRKVDTEAEREIYTTFMAAAGYGVSESGPPVADLEAAIRSVGNTPRDSILLADLARLWPNMTTEERRMAADLVRAVIGRFPHLGQSN